MTFCSLLRAVADRVLRIWADPTCVAVFALVPQPAAAIDMATAIAPFRRAVIGEIYHPGVPDPSVDRRERVAVWPRSAGAARLGRRVTASLEGGRVPNCADSLDVIVIPT